MDLASFIVGLVVAWIIALLIYWFGVQREETERIANSVPLNQHLTQVQEAEDRIAQLQGELHETRGALEEAQTERERLQAELEAMSAAKVQSQAQAAEPVEPSDLKRIEGIGPKIEEILNNAGIHTFQQLAETGVERLQSVLEDTGERYRLADPGSWPRQARLAAEDKWDELATLQDELKAGR